MNEKQKKEFREMNRALEEAVCPLEPMPGNLVVRIIDKDDEGTQIAIPDSAVSIERAMVMALPAFPEEDEEGQSWSERDEPGTMFLVPAMMEIPVEVGDIIYFPKGSGTLLYVEGTLFFVVPARMVLAKRRGVKKEK